MNKTNITISFIASALLTLIIWTLGQQMINKNGEIISITSWLYMFPTSSSSPSKFRFPFPAGLTGAMSVRSAKIPLCVALSVNNTEPCVATSLFSVI